MARRRRIFFTFELIRTPEMGFCKGFVVFDNWGKSPAAIFFKPNLLEIILI